ncbi:hypothetical protein GF373_01615 [bacterium]|nr:hypothetical protein [bacterium]
MESENLVKQRDRWIVAGLLALLFFLTPLYPQKVHYGFAFFFTSIIYLLVCILAYRVGWPFIGRALRASPFFLPGLLMLTWYLLGIFYAPEIHAAKAKFGMLFTIALLFGFFSLFPLKSNQTTLLLWSLVLGGFAAACQALYSQAVGHGALIESLHNHAIYSDTMREEMIKTLEANRAMGRFGNPNHLAGYLVLSLWPLWLLFKRTHIAWQKAFLCLFAVIMIFATYQTFSRSGVLVLLFSIFLFCAFEFLARGKGKLLRNILVAGCLLAVIAVPLFLLAAPSDFLGGRLTTTSTLVARWHFFRGALLIIQTHPWIGTGPESFEAYYSQYLRPGDMEAKYTHNLFLEAMVDGGIVNLMLSSWLIGILFFYLYHKWRKKPEHNLHTYAAAGAAAGFLLFSQIDFHYNLIEMYLIPIILLGLLVRQIPSTSSPHKSKLSPWLSLLLLLLWVGLVLSPFYNKTNKDLADSLMLEEKWYQARLCYDHAVTYDPTDADSWNGLGQTWQKIPTAAAQHKALAYFRQAVWWAPRSAALHADLAGQLFALGYTRQAVEEMRTAQTLFPARPQYYETMAAFYRQLGETEKAEEQQARADSIKQTMKERKI